MHVLEKIIWTPSLASLVPPAHNIKNNFISYAI